MGIVVNLGKFAALEGKPRGELVLKSALEYAGMGIRVVPNFPDTRMPAIEKWSTAASKDPDQINQWFGPGGPYEGFNLALMVEGFKVIDVDVKNGKDGFKVLAGAESGFSCPRAQTPHGGTHFIVSRTDIKEDPNNGLEILGNGKLFTVFPSVVDGVPYRWMVGGFPNPANRSRPNTTTLPTTEAVALAPAEYVRSLLEYIEPDCDYSIWLKVGMAIHHNDAGDIGLRLWDEWSQKGRKYKDGECDRKWVTFDTHRGKPTTLRWLILEAMRCGRRPTQEDILYHGNLFNSIEIDKINEKYGLFDLSGKMYIAYVEDGDIRLADPYNFKIKTADRKMEMGGKLCSVADVWLEHPERRIITEIGMWDLGKEPEGSLNAFQGFAVKPVECKESEISFFLDFCRVNICRGNVKYYEYLMDLLAAKLQNPMRLMKVCLVLRGGEGAGKGSLTRVMENIIGPKHAANVSSSNSWLGQYSGTILKGTLWLTANEAHWSGNHSQGERLKALISEEYLDMEEKYVNIRKQANRLMVAITSNNKWAVPASHDSRRYLVFDVDPSLAKNEAFWIEFNALMGVDEDTKEIINPEYLGKILYWMKNRKITHNLKYAMETEWLVKQRRQTVQDSPEEALIMWVRSSFTSENLPGDIITGAGGFSFQRVTHINGAESIRVDKLYEDYRAYVRKSTNKPRMIMNEGEFSEQLALLGMVKTRVLKERLKVGGRPLPDAKGNGAKTVVMALPSPDHIESMIGEHFSLFATGDIQDEDDSNC